MTATPESAPRPYRRMKRKPPKGTRCDMSIGADYTRKQPTVVRCSALATVEFKGGPLGWETWVCDEHAKALENKT